MVGIAVRARARAGVRACKGREGRMHLCEVDDEEEVQQPKRQGGACLPPHLVRVIGRL